MLQRNTSRVEDAIAEIENGLSIINCGDGTPLRGAARPSAMDASA